jgi:hypothetical protein
MNLVRDRNEVIGWQHVWGPQGVIAWSPLKGPEVNARTQIRVGESTDTDTRMQRIAKRIRLN